MRLLLQTPLLGHCSDLRGRKPWPPAFLLHRAGKWREKALLAWPAKPWRAALLLLWQLHFIDYRMQTNHLPAPFRPIAVPMQACAYTPLPIVLLHLTSGLPLLVYNVVQASSGHSGPLPACMPARPAGGLAAVVTASLPLHLCCRCSPPSLQPALQLPSRDAAAPGTPAPPFTACLPPLQVLCRWLTLQTCWGPTTGRPPLA